MRLPLSTLALGTCFLGVAAVFAQTWLQVDSGVLQLKQPSWSPPIPVKPSVTVPGVEAVSGTQIGLYMATIDRPLFAPDRRAPPPPDLVTQVPPPDPLATPWICASSSQRPFVKKRAQKICPLSL